MNYSQIDKDFIIRIDNAEYAYKGLISARRFAIVVNYGSRENLAKRIVRSVYKQGKQVHTVKLRRGIKLEFVSR